ncbi:MAG: hypothetical protein ACPGD8_01760 [Flavobacteriales bacterium]
MNHIILSISLLLNCIIGIAQPSKQPVQITSEIEIEPWLSHSFFDTTLWSYGNGILRLPDGTWRDNHDGILTKEDTSQRIHTANIQMKGREWNTIRFCDAKLVNDTLEIFINDFTASTYDNLKIRVFENRFSSQYWTAYVWNYQQKEFQWTTIEQSLILNQSELEFDKSIRGEIYFKCEERVLGESKTKPDTIELSGVFQAVIK